MDIKRNFSSIEQITGQYLNQQTQTKKTDVKEGSFADILKEKANVTAGDKLKFSKHADARLSQRNITLSEEQMKRLEDATAKAEEKGIKESLMLMDNMAFIVNVKNNTVITAMDQTDSRENVFTNIDGAVIA